MQTNIWKKLLRKYCKASLIFHQKIQNLCDFFQTTIPKEWGSNRGIKRFFLWSLTPEKEIDRVK